MGKVIQFVCIFFHQNLPDIYHLLILFKEDFCSENFGRRRHRSSRESSFPLLFYNRQEKSFAKDAAGMESCSVR